MLYCDINRIRRELVAVADRKDAEEDEENEVSSRELQMKVRRATEERDAVACLLLKVCDARI